MPRAFRTKFDRAVDKKERQAREKHNGMAPSREDLEHEETIAAYERAERVRPSVTPVLQQRLTEMIAKAQADRRRDASLPGSRRFPISISVSRATIDALDMIGMELGLNRGRTLDVLVAEYIGARSSEDAEDDDVDI